VPSQRLAVDELAEAVEESRFRRLDGDLGEGVLQAEVGQYSRRMRQQVDPDADRLDLRRRLEHAAGDPALMQLERKREAADAGADDEDLVHGSNSGSEPEFGSLRRSRVRALTPNSRVYRQVGFLKRAHATLRAQDH
jgi:hypothetical protein